MGFTFKSDGGRSYTYANVGKRDGIVAPTGSGMLNWKNIRSQPLQNGWKVDNEMISKINFKSLSAVKNSKYLPFRSGRLKNSIRYARHTTGFYIFIDDSPNTGAPHQYFLEFGTKKSTKHKGFWYDKIFYDVVNEILKITGGTIVEE